MADEVVIVAETDSDEELRPCALCGADIHPSSTRCASCGGHVAMAWGTVHKEHFLFLFCSLCIAVGCIVPWVTRWPSGVAGVRAEDVAGSLASPSGLATIRGALMFVVALYGVVAAIMNIVFRRLAMWPFVLSGMLALWVGLQGLSRGVGSASWEAWGKKLENENFLEKLIGQWRAIPVGFLLLTIAGVLVTITLIKGVVAGAASGRAKEKAKREESASRLSRARGPRGAGADAPPPSDAGTTPPSPTL
jgi:hypothetical protein